MPSHYLNQCWNIVNWTIENKLQWNLSRNLYVFIQENASENVVCELAFILSRSQCVKYTKHCQDTPPPTLNHLWSRACTLPGLVLESYPIDVIMTTMSTQITSLTVVYSTFYSDVDQRKHQSSASLAFVRGIHRDRWIPRAKGQLRGKCFHLMTSSCRATFGTPRGYQFIGLGPGRFFQRAGNWMSVAFNKWNEFC